MTVLNELASALGRRDELPNQALAQKIADKNDEAAIHTLVENLEHKNKDIQQDCIKVLYEVGERAPALIAPYAKQFIALLGHKNNRLQWGAMTALQTITLDKAALIHAYLPAIMTAVEKGSVITRDQAVQILVKLCTKRQYYEDAFTLLLEQLAACPVNQLPMYAELALPILSEKSKGSFIETLTGRLPEVDKDSKRKRIEKVLKKCS